MSQLGNIERSLGELLERTKDLPALTRMVTEHHTQLKNLHEEVIPPLKKEAEESKKRKWFAEGARVASALFAGFLGGHHG